MRQYDVYQNPDRETRVFAPYVVVLSSHLLDLDGVVVAPLVNDRRDDLKSLEVACVFDDRAMLASLTDIVAVDRHRLRNRVGDLEAYQDELRRGVDRLFSGF